MTVPLAAATDQTMPDRCLLVGDDPLVREGLALALSHGLARTAVTEVEGAAMAQRLFDAGGAYDLRLESVDAEGTPLILLSGAVVRGGALQAGPGDFPLTVPIPGAAPLDLRVQDTQITGALSIEGAELTIHDGWLSGWVSQADFLTALEIVPEPFRALAAGLVAPDLDLDGDGVNEGISACLQFMATPAVLRGFPVP